MVKAKIKARGKEHRVTRRAGKGMVMSVEALQSSFSTIDGKVARAIQGRASDSELMTVIQGAWHTQFHRPLSVAATRGLIEHYRATHREEGVSKRRTRRAAKRGQRGGMAPIDWGMGQGTTLPVYGSFPVEAGMSAQAVRTLDLGRFFESPISRACDSTGGAEPPKQTGGGLLDAIGLGHAPGSVPRNVLEMGVSAVQGAPISNPRADPMSSYAPGGSVVGAAPRPFDTSQVANLGGMAPIWTGKY
jgi:hypothetical protein